MDESIDININQIINQQRLLRGILENLNAKLTFKNPDSLPGWKVKAQKAIGRPPNIGDFDENAQILNIANSQLATKASIKH